MADIDNRCAEPGGAAEPPVAAVFSVQFWLRPVCRWAIYGFASGSRTWLSGQPKAFSQTSTPSSQLAEG